MMKAAVITRHAITNYGSLLQAIATEKLFETVGLECETIDYIRDDEYYTEQEKTNLKNKPKYNSNPLTRAAYLALRQGEAVKGGRFFRDMQKKYLHLTKRYHSLAELETDKPEADIYVTGSDQVWGKIANVDFDTAYLLSFTDDGDRRFSYASSIGKTKLVGETADCFKRYLSRYDAVTVRESNAKEALSEIGIEAQQVLDPTLLFGSDYWSTFIEKDIEGDYILLYQLENNKRFNDYAKKVAEKTGLRLIRVSPLRHQMLRGGEFVYLPSLGELLSYIKNAKCVITDSFHATAFSINFNTPFIDILPSGENKCRNTSVLELTGLTARILDNYENLSLIEEKCDFEYANTVLDAEREKSFETVKKILEI